MFKSANTSTFSVLDWFNNTMATEFALDWSNPRFAKNATVASISAAGKLTSCVRVLLKNVFLVDNGKFEKLWHFTQKRKEKNEKNA